MLTGMHRIDTVAVAQLADGLPGRDFDLDVGIAPGQPKLLTEAPSDRRLPGAHETGDDDMAGRILGRRHACQRI